MCGLGNLPRQGPHLRPKQAHACYACVPGVRTQAVYCAHARHETRASTVAVGAPVVLPGSAVSPVVTFTPNWKKILIGESITMTCDVGSTGGGDLTYTWYKDGKWDHTGKTFTILSAETAHSGYYSCGTSTERSDNARLDVVGGTLILRAPLYVHEGDDLTLRCHHRSGYTAKYTTFYKDGSVIQGWKETSELHVENVNMTNSGRYKCIKEIFLPEPYMKFVTYNDEDVINVQKLFAVPEIIMTPIPVVEGDHMTLTCDTSLSPLRPRTELKFAFYRDGRNVGEFSSSNRYGVQSAQVKDSGKYSCEVTTNSVQKRSQEIKIQINELSNRPTIIGIQYPEVEGDHMTLTCDTSLSPLRPGTQLQFAFYRDGRNVQEFGSSNHYGVQSAQLEDSGNYSCDVRTSDGKVRKSSHFLPIVIKELFSTPVLNVSTIKVLEGDAMTLTCDTSLSPLRPGIELQFAFYRDGRKVQEFNSSNQYGVRSAQLEDSGNYSCDVRSSARLVKKSAVVFIQIQDPFEVPEIIMTPIPVVEGDHMTLTCDTSLSPLRPRTELKFAFYRDGRNVGEFSSSNGYGVQSAQVKDSGKYSCEVTTNSVQKRSQEIKIQINELFVKPTIIGNQYPEVEGDHMTLTCDTSLSPLRPRTQLQFTFYRDGRNVQEFGPPNQYGVQSTQLEDSWNYSCEVRSSDGKVRKSSHFTPIVIKGKSRTDNTPIIMAALLVSLLVAAFLLFMYRHKPHRCPHQRRGRQPQISPTHAARESADAEVTYSELTLHRVP
ncbi:PREDICTED: Fc receptor-like protein 3 [Nanorana parkeri]|uniref:Fc receptor-like protein 3 n=1 Tax=Nanorana parkeri TaxID=125878 RepID=UPI000854A282|nr:PREDICTED: Fc receptor-like protein 3 [Nanorana parkeri]